MHTVPKRSYYLLALWNALRILFVFDRAPIPWGYHHVSRSEKIGVLWVRRVQFFEVVGPSGEHPIRVVFHCELDATKIRDVTQPITLKVEYNGEIVDPWGQIRAGFEINGKVNRQDFGLKSTYEPVYAKSTIANPKSPKISKTTGESNM